MTSGLAVRMSDALRLTHSARLIARSVEICRASVVATPRAGQLPAREGIGHQPAVALRFHAQNVLSMIPRNDYEKLA
jgi:hypothetical protein